MQEKREGLGPKDLSSLADEAASVPFHGRLSLFVFRFEQSPFDFLLITLVIACRDREVTAFSPAAWSRLKTSVRSQ
jgi:hypothetical protein